MLSNVVNECLHIELQGCFLKLSPPPPHALSQKRSFKQQLHAPNSTVLFLSILLIKYEQKEGLFYVYTTDYIAFYS